MTTFEECLDRANAADARVVKLVEEINVDEVNAGNSSNLRVLESAVTDFDEKWMIVMKHPDLYTNSDGSPVSKEALAEGQAEVAVVHIKRCNYMDDVRRLVNIGKSALRMWSVFMKYRMNLKKMERQRRRRRQQQSTCSCCQSEEVNIQLQPCNHVVLCVNCRDEARKNKLFKCPVCRQRVFSYLKI